MNIQNDSILISIEFCSTDDDRKIEEIRSALSPASKFANISSSTYITKRQAVEEKLKNKTIPICYHRGDMKTAGNDVSIYYEGFQTFADECKSISITRDDCVNAYTLCIHMANVYEKEYLRRDMLLDFFQKYVDKDCCACQTQTSPEADIFLHNVLLVQVKNEPGSTDCDPLREVISYYCQGLTSNNRCPCFIVEVSGPNLTIYGAVYGGSVYVDRLVPPLWLVPQIKNSDAMLKIARTLTALKRAVNTLNEYQKLKPLGNPRYPDFCI